MAIVKYLRVGDTMVLKPNGARWLRIPSHKVDNYPSGIIYESEDGTPVWTWFTDAHEMRCHTSEPAAESDGASVAAASGTALTGAVIADEVVIRGHGGARITQSTGISIDDSDIMSGVVGLVVDDDGTVGSASATDAMTIDSSGNVSFIADVLIPDGGNIGSATDTDAIAIATTGEVTLTQDLHLDGDDLELQLGNETNDSYILFDGTHLIFYDTNVGLELSLEDLRTGTQLNPSVVGDLSIQEGKFDWTNAVDEVAGTWSFANTSASDIDLATSVQDGECIEIIANALTSGKVIKIDADSIAAAGALVRLEITTATHDAAGFFLEAHDHTNGNVFSIGKFGALIIAGTAEGTDVITLTKGDVSLADGDLLVDAGFIQVNSTDDDASYIKRNKDTASTALLTLENTHTGDVGTALKIDHKGIGNSSCIDLDFAGDSDAITIDASAARNGDVFNINMANMLDERAFYIHGSITAAAGEGLVHIDLGTGVLNATGNALLIEGSGNHATASHMVELNYDTGTIAGATSGMILGVYDTSVAVGTSYAVEIASTNNEALHVNAGMVQVDEYVSAVGFVTQAHGALATVAGATTGTLYLGESFISVTSDNDAHIILLPEAVAGNIVWIMNEDAAQDVELTAKAGDTINGGAAGGASTLAFSVLARCVATTAAKWVVTEFAADGTESAMTASA